MKPERSVVLMISSAFSVAGEPFDWRNSIPTSNPDPCIKVRSQISNLRFRTLIHGSGLLVGMELRQSNGSPATEKALEIIKTTLRSGFILLPEGEHSNVVSFTPPLTITEDQLRGVVKELKTHLTPCA